MARPEGSAPKNRSPELPLDPEVALWWTILQVIGFRRVADWLQWWLLRRMQLQDWFYGSAVLAAGLACLASERPLLTGIGVCVTHAAAWYLLAVMLPLVSWQPLRFVVVAVRQWAALNIIFSAAAVPVFVVFIFVMTRLD